MEREINEKVKNINESISFVIETAETLRKLKNVKIQEPYCQMFLNEIRNILNCENKK